MGKETRWRRLLRIFAVALAVGGGAWLVWPLAFPFLVGLAVARAAEPVVAVLGQRLGFPRWLGAFCAVTGLYLLVGLGGWLLCRVLLQQLWRFLRAVPELAGNMAGPIEELRQTMLELANRFPDGIGDALDQGVREFFRTGAGLGQRLYDWAFRAASSVLGSLPDLGLFLLTAVLSSFMLSAKLPRLRALWQQKAPRQLSRVGSAVKRTLCTWLLAQGKLMVLIWSLLTVGFLLLGIDYAFLFGLGIAVLDALPVLGTGSVLIPWGLLCFLQGRTGRGVGLLLLYGAAALARTALEPRLLGRQVGLDPLVTLLSLYAGYRLCGVGGLILFPMGTLMAKQLWDRWEVDKSE